MNPSNRLAARSPWGADAAPAGGLPHPGRSARCFRRITVTDCQLALAHGEPTEAVSMSDLLRAANRAKAVGDARRAGLYLHMVQRMLRARQVEAYRDLREWDEL